jgi:hypothetical protein
MAGKVRQKKCSKKIVTEKPWQKKCGGKIAQEKCGRKTMVEKVRLKNRGKKNHGSRTLQEEKGMVFICVVLNL